MEAPIFCRPQPLMAPADQAGPSFTIFKKPDGFAHSSCRCRFYLSGGALPICQWLSPSSLPESTPCTQANKNETARSGSILAMYLITLSSLLYAYPHRLRTSTITSPPMAATMRARSTTTQAARRAACGRPAPSSFETRVLHDVNVTMGKSYCKDDFANLIF